MSSRIAFRAVRCKEKTHRELFRVYGDFSRRDTRQNAITQSSQKNKRVKIYSGIMTQVHLVAVKRLECQKEPSAD